MKTKLIFISLLILALQLASIYPSFSQVAKENSNSYLFNDAHFHLTNYIQEGTDIHVYLKNIMGDQIGRSTLFGLPLQQQWSYRVTEDFAPTYYLDTDAHLYYYSFTDAMIAMAYKSLDTIDQQRIDPMITGFNVTDMYATEHIKRVLLTFPGVFSGIGEFSIHKEFVSSKIEGDVASFYDPALDRILDFAAEAGLIAIVHNDIDNPYPKAGKPNYLTGMQDLIKRHPATTIIWAHLGLGRVIKPIQDMDGLFEKMLQDPAYANLYFDLSWDETAKWLDSSPESLGRTVEIIKKYPDRFLFGTDNVAPQEQETQLRVYHLYDRLWEALGLEITQKVSKTNYERLFDKARQDVRAWEKTNAK